MVELFLGIISNKQEKPGPLEWIDKCI